MENDRSEKLQVPRKQEQQLLKAQKVPKVTPRENFFFLYQKRKQVKNKVTVKSIVVFSSVQKEKKNERKEKYLR